MSKRVAIIMGSDSDFPVMKNTIKRLKDWDISVETHVMSAHRTPERACEFARTAKDNGFAVIIAAAGKAAHLAGVLAGHTTLPVIGVPIKSSTMDGLDSLLSTVQMPSGIPVATVAIDGADNAAILATQILAISDENLAEKLEQFKKDMVEGVIKKDEALQVQIKNL
ncbi:MAG: 5-(carboxyamino)imidazole ribonucleotide mutase [Candidatus Epulonipiscium fishelsonii]|nr:MAG: 5-(carboxyamino)imidazole ribonucleotide mutase [Epulopiscium sp. AS2M-Bin002]